MSYYPLATGNSWTYTMKDGNTYTNEVTAAEGNLFTMKNSMMPNATQIKQEGDEFHANHWDGTTFQLLLKDTDEKGYDWDVKFTANGLENILRHVIKDTGLTKEVAGKTYTDIMLIEAESMLMMNGSLITLSYFTQYYYAKGVGLVLVTTSAGDEHNLTASVLN
ncbi:MAG: hypothetical protein JNM19_16575 [Chitinophagaceae bacterium]|nr:hypothetical protein [Chitinophagaceae bacterium]